jgi:hypothetical protein
LKAEPIPEEQRGVSQHHFISYKDAEAYIADMLDHCTLYAFKMSYKLEHQGNDVWRVTLWVKDD